MAKQSFKAKLAKQASARDIGVGLLIWGWIFMVIAAWRDDLTLVAAHGLIMLVGAVLTLHPPRQRPATHVHIEANGLNPADVAERVRIASIRTNNPTSK